MSQHKFLSAFALLCGMVLLSCAKNEGATDAQRDGLSLNLGIAPSSTRTWLDSSVDEGPLPVYWSDGDRVAVNGTTSSPIRVEDGQKLSSAIFQLRNVSAPYKIVYPAAAWKGSSESGILIDIPATQEWTEGSFASGAAILYGESQDGSSASLQNLCGAIRVRLNDSEGSVIKSLKISSLGGEAIAGNFILKDGSLSAAAQGGTSEISMTIPETGVALSAEGTDFYFAIPAGSYSKGFLIRFDDARKHIQRSFWLRESEEAEEGVSVVAGRIVCFANSAYDPDAREICSPEDWEEFAAAYNSAADGWEDEWLCKDGSVRIGADFQAESLTPVSILTGVLDGCGHTITMSAMTSPLVRSLTGSDAAIRNLTIAGTNAPADLNLASIFAGNLKEGATIENCTNKAVLSIFADQKTVTAPFARDLYYGSILNCTNEADVKPSIDISDGDYPVTAAGIVATVKPLSGDALEGPCLIKGCTNKGDVIITLIKPSNNNKKPVCAGYGGILGTVLAGDETNFLRIENCVNEGDISLKLQNDPTTSNGSLSGVGGIVGMAANITSNGTNFIWSKRGSNVLADEFDSFDGIYFEMSGCTNYGSTNNDVTSVCSSDEPYKAFSGGLIGVVNGLQAAHAKIDSCSNFGNVTVYQGVSYTRAALGQGAGGFAGYAGYADFTDCVQKAQKVGSMKWHSYSASGGLGYVHLAFKMIRCKIFSEIDLVRATNYSQDNYSLGFTISSRVNTQGGVKPNILELEGSEVTDCSFGGSISLSANVVIYSAKTGFGNAVVTNITASNFDQFIASPSANVNHFEKTAFGSHSSGLGYKILDKIRISGSSYWDGTLSE